MVDLGIKWLPFLTPNSLPLALEPAAGSCGELGFFP